MNKRIRELSQEARKKPLGNSWCYTNPQEFEQKFAELIVWECLEQVDQFRDKCDKDGDHQQALGAHWAGLAVSMHFGVEE